MLLLYYCKAHWSLFWGYCAIEDWLLFPVVFIIIIIWKCNIQYVTRLHVTDLESNKVLINQIMHQRVSFDGYIYRYHVYCIIIDMYMYTTSSLNSKYFVIICNLFLLLLKEYIVYMKLFRKYVQFSNTFSSFHH